MKLDDSCIIEKLADHSGCCQRKWACAMKNLKKDRWPIIGQGAGRYNIRRLANNIILARKLGGRATSVIITETKESMWFLKIMTMGQNPMRDIPLPARVTRRDLSWELRLKYRRWSQRKTLIWKLSVPMVPTTLTYFNELVHLIFPTV